MRVSFLPLLFPACLAEMGSHPWTVPSLRDDTTHTIDHSTAKSFVLLVTPVFHSPQTGLELAVHER